MISQENTVTLAKIRDKKHLEEDIGAVGWTMEKEDVEKLKKDYPDQEFVSEAVPLEEWE